MNPDAPYPVQYSVDYPDRPLDRVTTLFRLFMVLPIAIVIALIEGGGYAYSGGRTAGAIGAAGPVVLPTLLSTDGGPLSLHGRASGGASRVSLSGRAQRPQRWLPLVKWLLANPHYVVLFFLYIAAFFVVIAAWFAILFTGRFPRGMFDFLVGVGRWTNRVIAYAHVLVTDRYPPFRLAP